MKLARATIAMAAFAAIFVVPSVASASPELTHPTGTRAPVGTLIEAHNEFHAATPTQTVMTTSAGNVACGRATLTGEVTSNTGTHIAGNITTAQFAGTHEKTATGHCAGNALLGSQIFPTPSHASDETKSLPWCITANKGDNFSVRGGKCGEAARPVTFTIHGNITCGYEKAEVTGTFTTHPTDAIATITNQTFTRSAGSSSFCPATGSLDMAFTMTTDGTNTPLYIS